VNEIDGSTTATLALSPASPVDQVVTLASSDPSRLSVPTAITIPAGQTSVPVPLTILDNTVLDGLEAVSITGTTSQYSPASGTVTVHDNESATLSVNLPAAATEGDGPVAGTITASEAPTAISPCNFLPTARHA